MVLFEDIEFGVEEAYDALLDSGFSLLRQADSLAVWWKAGPLLFITAVRGERVRQASAEIGRDTPYASELSQCSARIEIAFDDLEEVRTEIDSLVDVQGILQEATQGFIFNTWNRKLAPPT